MSDGVIQQILGLYEQRGPERSAEQLLKADLPLFVYGAGKVGKDVCRALKARGFKVRAFLDRRAALGGEAWEGTPICLPEDAALATEVRRASQVVVAVLNSEADPLEIRKGLQARGHGRVISLVECHAALAGDLGRRFWLGPRQNYVAQKEEIAWAYSLFSDAASRATFRALLRWRLLDDDAGLPRPTPRDQYFPEGLPAWPQPLRFVDCGAFDGDTVRQLGQRGLAVEAIAAFEPDPANFRKLEESVCSGPFATKASLFQKAVGAKRETLRFAAEGGLGSHASATGDIEIECVPLDEVLADFQPNLIKMDIEGAELDALHGAQGLVKTHRPGLAICLYHQAEHLWQIPLFAATLVPGARHFLRLHAQCGFELVYYAVPE